MRVYTGSAWVATYLPASGYAALSGNNAFTGANTFYNATGQTFGQTAAQDGIVVTGRAGGTSNYRVTFTPNTLTGNRTLTAPDVSGTILTTGAAVTVPQGGTGITTATAYALLTGGTTSTGALQQVSGTGTSGQLLTSNGSGALPSWQTPNYASTGKAIAMAIVFG
jgi:hypothetical protein